MILALKARPIPVPLLVFLVVKNGSKILFLTSSLMPIPLSSMEITKFSYLFHTLILINFSKESFFSKTASFAFDKRLIITC